MVDREKFLALLEANHSYPMDYRVQVILRQDEALIAGVLTVLAEQVGLPHLEDRHVRVPSSKGSWVSLRVDLPVSAPADVLAIYERLGQIEGLKTWF